jgi:uroporphyrin-III C-methyltransferase
MNTESTHGILVVGHGSRREEANEDVREAARRISSCGHFPLVRAAFLEIAEPTIAEAYSQLVLSGARQITVHPYFLSPGRHTRGDIPVEVSAAASRHPDVGYVITEPLSAHRHVVEASVERIRESQGFESKPYKETEARQGVVYLVGAGPGEPGLLTIRARDLLATCDAVVYDYLVNPEILDYTPSCAERIYVGKTGRGRQTSQVEINQLLITLAGSHKRVVRLKGGDPFLFGRGGEEAVALVDAGVPFEVVPGISSALAVPAYAGIPLTHRGLSSSVAVVTGARAGDGATASESLANAAKAETIIVLMGATHIREIANDLMNAGRAPETPAAVVRWGTYESQQVVTGTLETITDEAERAGMRSPAVIIVGEVVRLRERLNWFEKIPANTRDTELEYTLAAAH